MKSNKIITIDVGNSRIKIGLFERPVNNDVSSLPKYLQSTAIPIDKTIHWDKLSEWTDDPSSVNFAILGGVNPRGMDKILDGWPASGWPTPVIVNNPLALPIKINLKSPRTVGIDRLLNAIAGNIIRPIDKPMIIIDSGTATTVDVISQEGLFEGGAILPGVQLCAQALHQYTALLPRIKNEEIAKKVPDPLGKNTRDAMRSGLFWGQLGAIKELVKHFEDLLEDEGVIVITGGAGRLLAPNFEAEAIHEPFLALQGLVIAALELNNHD